MKNLSKKRAIKLLMSRGIGKRKAEKIVGEMRIRPTLDIAIELTAKKIVEEFLKK